MELDGKQFFVSRFLDIADSQDLVKERVELKNDVDKFLEDGKIIFQFDQVDKKVPGYQQVTLEELIKKSTNR